MKKLYYVCTCSAPWILKVFHIQQNELHQICLIPCEQSDNILFTIEEYLRENQIDLKFDELIPL